MATASNSESRADAEPAPDAASRSDTESASEDESSPDAESDSSSMVDRLATAGRIVWWSFLGFVVVFALIPVVGLWLGAVPFAPPPVAPYFALVGLAVLGTAALVATAVYDV